MYEGYYYVYRLGKSALWSDKSTLKMFWKSWTKSKEEKVPGCYRHKAMIRNCNKTASFDTFISCILNKLQEMNCITFWVPKDCSREMRRAHLWHNAEMQESQKYQIQRKDENACVILPGKGQNLCYYITRKNPCNEKGL